jgi:hypothetical protein
MSLPTDPARTIRSDGSGIEQQRRESRRVRRGHLQEGRHADRLPQGHASVIITYRNMFYYDIFSHRRVDQLPIAPYAALRLEVQ